MTARNVEDAAAQLRRLLLAIPALADDKPHKISDVARKVGADAATLARDLRTLVTRFEDGPPGFVDDVQVMLGHDTVEIRSPRFKRPMGLSGHELRALELGLAMIQQESAPHEHRAIESARERINRAATARQDDHRGARQSTSASAFSGETFLSPLRAAIGARCKATIRYQSANASAISSRTVHPYGTIHARGRWFLIAFCERTSSMRVFRVDRIKGVNVLRSAPASLPDALALSDWLDRGRVLAHQRTELLRISYGPRIARWIVEREGGDTQADGSVIVEHPLVDDEWAVRHVLQYGPEAVVLGPERVRRAVAQRLAAVLGGS